MADLRTEAGWNRRVWTALVRLLTLLIAIPWGLSVALGQYRPEPPGLMPPANGQPFEPRVANPDVPPPSDFTTDAADEMVVDVRIVGNKSLSLDKILPHVRTRAGRKFDLELVEEDVRRLDHTHMFVNVKTYSQQVADGRVVIFDIVERPLLQDVKFVGCKKIHKKSLQKESGLKVGDPLDPFAIEESRGKLADFYRERGFTNVQIKLLEGNKPEDRRAVFYINEGTKQRVWKVDFIGNTIASDDRLKTQIKSKAPLLFLFKGELDRKQIDEDVERLTAYYRGLGFFRARIGRELKFNEKNDWVTVTFVIDEGVRYKIRNVSVIGNSKYSSEDLLAKLKLENEEYFNQDRMMADVRTLQDEYGSVGYVFADIKPDPRFLEEPGQLDLVYNITEGDRYRVGKIDVKIKGEYPHTQLTTVLNRLSIKPGDIVDIRKIRDSERRLRASRLFESNPATGNAPKIVFSPPDQEEEGMIARKPKPPARPRSNFRGQSPDSASRDRVLNVVYDCGRYVGTGDQGVRVLQNQGAVSGDQDNQEDELWRATRELTSALASSKRRGLSPTRLIPTQYTPAAGKVNPASQSGLQWSNGAATPNSTSTAGYAPSTPPADDPPRATPVEPAPAYGNPMSPRQGPPKLVESPEGPYVPGPVFNEASPFLGGPPDGADPMRSLDFTIRTEETMTGKMMFGVGINSDAGLVGSIVLDEQNFNWTRFPNSWEDIRNASAWRGAGQRFRLEAAPGSEVQRYSISFQEPYMFNTPVSMGLSGYYYSRSYQEWDEQRLGGRIAWGYQFSPDLSGNIAYRGAKINITDPIDPTLPELAEVTGRDLALHGFQVSLSNDKRDSAFMATEGYLLEMSLEQVLGSFQYPRAELDLRKYFTLHERPDGSGRHVLSLAGRAGYTGDDTPIYEHYFAGGFSTIRGFEYRGASPHVYSATAAGDIFVGGQFQLLASVEYMFPITADDMMRGVVFCDTGTVEPNIDDWSDRYRVAPGFGLRITMPAMGPAPIALDFAFPVSRQPGDRQEMFSFFMGFGR